MIITAEIGINHNGDVELANRMIDAAKVAGCDYVKFQKRTVEKVYTQEELNRPRKSPWGTTNREQKMGLEFGEHDYDYINSYCDLIGMKWYASPWDWDSVDFLSFYDPPFIKIASACITDMNLLQRVRETGIPVIISTGMSTRNEVVKCVEHLADQIEYILACTSTYPTAPQEMNLRFIQTLKQDSLCGKYKIGFSNHSPGINFCFVAAAMGAEMIEFHLTLDRSMYGSDQAASIELPGAISLCKSCRNIEAAMGTGQWTVFDSEQNIKEKLRRC